MIKLRLSTQPNMHPKNGRSLGETLCDGIAFHKRIGFEALDFPVFALDLTKDGAWEPTVESALLAAHTEMIRFEVCHLPYSTRLNTDPDFVPIFNERMHRAIEAAVALGVKHAVLHPNTLTLPMENYNEALERENVLAHLSPFAEHAARVGLSLAVENMRLVHSHTPVHRYCQEPNELCDIADALGCGICWDFGHANVSRVKQSEGLKSVGKRLAVLHVNDNSGLDDEHTPPFTGTVDWKDAMHGLSLAGFEGLLNYELATGRIPDGARESFARYAVDAAHELLKLIE